MEYETKKQEKQYKTYKCALCGAVMASKAKTPRCGNCGTRKLNLKDEPALKVASEDPAIPDPVKQDESNEQDEGGRDDYW